MMFLVYKIVKMSQLGETCTNVKSPLAISNLTQFLPLSNILRTLKIYEKSFILQHAICHILLAKHTIRCKKNVSARSNLHMYKHKNYTDVRNEKSISVPCIFEYVRLYRLLQAETF